MVEPVVLEVVDSSGIAQGNDKFAPSCGGLHKSFRSSGTASTTGTSTVGSTATHPASYDEDEGPSLQALAAEATRARRHSAFGAAGPRGGGSFHGSSPSDEEASASRCPPTRECRRSSEPTSSSAQLRVSSDGSAVDRRSYLQKLKKIRDADKKQAQSKAKELSRNLLSREKGSRSQQKQQLEKQWRKASEGDDVNADPKTHRRDDPIISNAAVEEVPAFVSAEVPAFVSPFERGTLSARLRNRRNQSSEEVDDAACASDGTAASADGRASSRTQRVGASPRSLSRDALRALSRTRSGHAGHEERAASLSRRQSRPSPSEVATVGGDGAAPSFPSVGQHSSMGHVPASSAELSSSSGARSAGSAHGVTGRKISLLHSRSDLARRGSTGAMSQGGTASAEFQCPHRRSEEGPPEARHHSLGFLSLDAVVEPPLGGRADLGDRSRKQKEQTLRDVSNSRLSQEDDMRSGRDAKTSNTATEDESHEKVELGMTEEVAALECEAVKLRQENAIFRDRCRTLKSERDRLSHHAHALEGEVEALRGDLAELTRGGDSSEDGGNAPTLRMKLRRACEEARIKAQQHEEASAEISRLEGEISKCQRYCQGRMMASSVSDCDREFDLCRMEEVLRAKDVALSAAREEAARLRARLEDQTREAMLCDVGESEVDQLKRRLTEIEAENLMLWERLQSR